jgi:hypothetical protein
MNKSFFKLLNTVPFSEKKLYQETWNKKHISAWFFLRKAVRSSLMDAIYTTSQWLQNCSKSKNKCGSLAERAFIADFNYSLMLSGPFLSTIIMSAASIEAFLRHCYVSVCRTKFQKIDREKLLGKIAEFDKKPPLKKIQDIISEIEAHPLPEKTEREIGDLFSFRNDVMHSDPIYHSHGFSQIIQLKRGKEKKPRHYEYYPDITLTTRPLTLAHVILSTTSHDKLIQHIIETAKNLSILNFLDEIDMMDDDKGLVWKGIMPGIDYNSAKLLSEEMDALNRQLSSVTLKEKIDFLKLYFTAEK